MILKKTIVIIGYMGCGKTTLGKKLSKHYQLPFIDLDAEIVSFENNPIEKIFQTKGELYFRRIEYKILLKIIKNSSKSIISLGGGTPCYFDTIELLNKNEKIHTFYLKTDISILTDRLFIDKNKRPIIKSIGSKNLLKEFVGKHLFERSTYYNKAKSILVTNNKSLNSLVNEVKEILA